MSPLYGAGPTCSCKWRWGAIEIVSWWNQALLKAVIFTDAVKNYVRVQFCGKILELHAKLFRFTMFTAWVQLYIPPPEVLAQYCVIWDRMDGNRKLCTTSVWDRSSCIAHPGIYSLMWVWRLWEHCCPCNNVVCKCVYVSYSTRGLWRCQLTFDPQMFAPNQRSRSQRWLQLRWYRTAQFHR